MSNTRTVAVIFGGRSAEHEVSILTAHEAMAVLREMPGYDVVPVYITKGGRWLTGAALDDLDKFADPDKLEADCKPVTLRPMVAEQLSTEKPGLLGKKEEAFAVDVALPLVHGPNGEDGTLQGLLEMLGIPYASSGVLSSALCMNKVATKRMLLQAGLAQVDFEVVSRSQWAAEKTDALARAGRLGDGKVFVKPVRGGSSIGITFVETPEALAPAIDLALSFDEEAVIEAAVTGAQEVNCSVLRDGDEIVASVLEAVAAKDGFLTYDQKYLQWSKGAPVKGAVEGHAIPAPLLEAKTEQVRSLAKRAYEVCMCDGIVRVDFLLREDDVFVNEINTAPGSLAFYLWEATGIGFEELLDTVLKNAMVRGEGRATLTYSLERNLLADIEARKGAKRP